MPFINPFKKTRKSKPKKTPLVIADIHEKNSLVISELHKSDEIILKITYLKISDYVIGDIAIERKTVNDFISSMINKRLIQQLNQMKKYKKALLIIEGDLNEIYNQNNNLSQALRGFLLSITSNYNTPIIQTSDYEDTSKYLITLAKQQIKPKTQISLHSRIPKTIQEQKQYILEAFPNIGPVKAKKLLEKFKTIKNIINSEQEELQELIGKKSEIMKQIVEREY